MKRLLLFTVVLSTFSGIEAANQCSSSYSKWFPDDQNVIVDFMVHYRCPPGFTLEDGDEMATCSNSTMNPPKKLPRCVNVPMPKCPEGHASCKMSNFTVGCSTKEYSNKSDTFCQGDRIYFICNKECRRVGNNSFIQCQSDGSWSQTDVRCEVPPEIHCSHSDLGFTQSEFVEPFTRQPTYSPGTIVKFQCKNQREFCMMGTDTRTCLPNGTWSEAPKCLNPMCPYNVTRPLPGSGVYIFSESNTTDKTHFYHGSHVHYKCNDSYGNMTGAAYIECLCPSDGNWTDRTRLIALEELPPRCEKCKPDPCVKCGACLRPPRLDEFSYTTNPEESGHSESNYFSVGTTITIQRCLNDKIAVGGNSTLTCQQAPNSSGFVWDGTLPYCEKDCLLPSGNIGNGRSYITEPAGPSKYRILDKEQKSKSNTSVHPGTRLYYFCHTGYVANGAVARQCLQNGTWLPANEPECTLNITNSECCTAPNYDYVEPDQNRSTGELRTPKTGNVKQYELGGTIFWKCKEGYTNLQPVNANSTCKKGDDGQYVFDKLDQKCDKTHGTYPVSMRAGGITSTSTKQRSTLISTNDESMELSMEPEEGVEHSQLIVFCIKPATPAYSYETETRTKGKAFHPLRFESGDTISYRCKSAFAAIGDTFITCLKNGRWSSKPPRCARQTYCIDPVRSTNATQYLATLRFKEESYLFGVDAVIYYRCKRGQYLVGADRIVCMNDGTWSEKPGVCLEAGTTCLNPNGPSNARLVSISGADSQEFYPGSRVTYACASGYASSSELTTSTWTCQPDGSWSESNSLRCSVSVVEPKLSLCSMPTVPEHVSHVYMSMAVIGDENQFVPGGSIIYRCDDNYNPLGNDRIVCQTDGTWSAVPPLCGMELTDYLAMRH